MNYYLQVKAFCQSPCLLIQLRITCLGAIEVAHQVLVTVATMIVYQVIALVYHFFGKLEGYPLGACSVYLAREYPVEILPVVRIVVYCPLQEGRHIGHMNDNHLTC